MTAKKGAGKTAEEYFSPETFEFLRQLKRNNSREWFEASKARYERDVKGPMLRFIADFSGRLRTLSKRFVADPRPVGGSMFRIYRDVRFSMDKSPYKTHAAAHFSHSDCGKDVHSPGFYLHLEPGDSFGGGGLWHPNGATLKKIRDRIASRPKDWKTVLGTGLAIEGDKLTRPPQGYDPGHSHIEHLKHKDFYTTTAFSEKEVCSPDFLDRYTEACRTAIFLVEFLTNAVGLRW